MRNNRYTNFLLIWLAVYSINRIYAQQNWVVVHLASGDSVKGALLEMSSESVRLDLDGSSITQAINAINIDYIFISATQERVYYPLNETSNISSPLIKKLLKRKKHIPHPREVSLFGCYGSTGNMFESVKDAEGGNYRSGGLLQFGLRYHFHTVVPGGIGSFVEFSYYHTSISTNVVTYNPVNYSAIAQKRNVGVNNFSINYSWHTVNMGYNSYLNFLIGFSLFSMNGGDEIGLVNNAFGVRLGGGSVIGILPKINLMVNFLVDLTYLGSETKTTIVGTREKRPKTAGGLYFINWGLMYDLK